LKDYYKKSLSAKRLESVYQLAPPRVVQYLDAEIAFVIERIGSSGIVLELGCGYGRVLERLITKANLVVGIDSSDANLRLAENRFRNNPHILLAQMDAATVGFGVRLFDAVVCIQNGISAFHVDPADLIRESMRVTKKGGVVLFSSYSAKFWEDRLEWFRIQSEKGLIGEIDWSQTHDGEIVCKDGFRGITFGPDDFASLAAQLGLHCRISEIDNSSIFCEITV